MRFPSLQFDAKMRFNTLQVRFKPLKWRPKIENSRFQERVLPKARFLLNLPFRKLGSRMDGLIFVLGVNVKFHQSCDYFNVYTVNGKSLKIIATLDANMKCAEHDP